MGARPASATPWGSDRKSLFQSVCSILLPSSTFAGIRWIMTARLNRPTSLRSGFGFKAMTATSHMDLFKQAVAQYGQTTVVRALGYSVSAVNQVLKGNYKGDLTNVLKRVNEVYGATTIQRCAAERRKPFAMTSPQRVRLFKECRTCRAHRSLDRPAQDRTGQKRRRADRLASQKHAGPVQLHPSDSYWFFEHARFKRELPG